MFSIAGEDLRLGLTPYQNEQLPVVSQLMLVLEVAERFLMSPI
jgi:hypothetical protein